MEGRVSILSLLEGFTGERPTHLTGRDMLIPPPPHICAQAFLIVFKMGEELLLPASWGGAVRKPQAALLSLGRQLHCDLCTQELDKDMGWG